jgi:hypothetical protein
MFIRRRIFQVMAALIVLLGFAFGQAGSASAADTTKWLAIQPAHSGHNLDVQGGSTADGAPIIQWYRGYTSAGAFVANQRWKFAAVPNTYDTYYITSELSGKVLTVQRYTAGAPVVQLTNVGSPGQQWHEEYVGAARKFRNVATGLYLDVSGASYAAGAPIIQWYRTDGLNQQFYLADLAT